MPPVEQWRAIDGCKGYYDISDLGNVYSLRKAGLIKPFIDRYGYQKVVLFIDGKAHYRTVHRLVALAFIPNPEKKPAVNHLNEDKCDNRVENLEWSTFKENDNYGTRNKRMALTKCKRPVTLTCPDGREIHYQGVKEASRDTGIAHSQISKACKNNMKTKYGYVWRYTNELY